jgi:hypothetical protein
MSDRPVFEPWYVSSDREFYHNHFKCSAGLRPRSAERFAGDGRRRLCPECKQLNAAVPGSPAGAADRHREHGQLP